MRHTFFVPVRVSKAGTLTLQTGRLRSGERVGLAFTSESALALTLGPSQRWIHLDREALAEMLVPLGVEHIRVDPHRVGEPRSKTCHNGGKRVHSGSAGRGGSPPHGRSGCWATAHGSGIPGAAPDFDISTPGRELAGDPPADQQRADRSALSRGRRMLLDGPRAR
ncbi:MAG TPA: SAV_915 family protein [Trebonia sp.]